MEPQVWTRGLARAGAAFVAVVAGAALLYTVVSDRGPVADTPSPPLVSPGAITVAAEPDVTVAMSPLPMGSELLLWDGDSVGAQIIVTIPGPGWLGRSGSGTLIKYDNTGGSDGAGLIVYAEPTKLSGGHDIWVYGEPCLWRSSAKTQVTTVEGAVAALSSQPSRDASAPVDVVVGGYAGKSITLHNPFYADLGACDQGEFRTFIPFDGPQLALDSGQIERLWILDVDGDLLIFDAVFHAETPQDVIDQLDAIVESAVLNSPNPGTCLQGSHGTVYRRCRFVG